jgi:sugar phosphate isomerase/epimerase
MRLSIVLSTQPASFSALAYKGQLAENIQKIRNLGFDGVELAVRDPKILDINELQSLLTANELPVPALGTGQAYGEEGLSFTDPDEKVREKAIERIKSHIALAGKLNTLVIIGLIRGTADKNIDQKTSELWLVEALQETAANDDSVNLAIEPINRYETNLVNTVTDGLKLLEKVDRNNVGLLLDTFHMNIEEPSIIDSMVSSKEHLFHFHIADSNRWYPGAGHIDFRKILNALDKIGYNGFVSAEILPNPDPDTAAQKTISFMKLLR